MLNIIQKCRAIIVGLSLTLSNVYYLSWTRFDCKSAIACHAINKLVVLLSCIQTQTRQVDIGCFRHRWLLLNRVSTSTSKRAWEHISSVLFVQVSCWVQVNRPSVDGPAIVVLVSLQSRIPEDSAPCREYFERKKNKCWTSAKLPRHPRESLLN